MSVFARLCCLAFILFLSACDPICKEYQINVAFVGFKPADIDTFIVKAYKADGSYATLLDSLKVIKQMNGAGNGIFTTSNDTTVAFINDPSKYASITYLYDWKIVIPAKNKTVLISHIVSNPGSGKRGCLNSVASFMQDGATVNTPSFFSTDKFYTTGYRVFILL